MVLTEESALSKISNMVDNFETMCCNDSPCGRKKSRRMRNVAYTNFSMKEILKPNFGKIFNYDSDSDGTRNFSESPDNYSSADESIDSQHEFHDSEDPRTFSNVSERFPANVSSELSAEAMYPAELQQRPFSAFHRFRRQYHDDDYASSESSDNESALDLRLDRKKTPPKMSGEIPAWVFCTRYSDRPAAGPRSRRRRTATTTKPKRIRTAFNEQQLRLLNIEYEKDKYLSEARRHRLATDLDLNETNLKIWFQNRRAKDKKDEDVRPLAQRLKAEGLYNHKGGVGVNNKLTSDGQAPL